MTYSPPAYGSADDGLVFPLTYAAIVRDEIITDGDQAAIIAATVPPGPSTGVVAFADSTKLNIDRINTALTGGSVGVWYELELPPLNGSFEQSFDLAVGTMSIPAQVNLEAA